MKYFTGILIFAAFMLTFGCGNPSDLPPLAKFQVTITKAGTPAEGVTVTVHSESLPNKYNCYGVTDANGVIVLSTYSHVDKRKFSGAPIGETKIGVRRSGDFGLEDPREATKGMSRDESYAYAAERSKRTAENEKFVPISLSDPLISPIEFTVVEKTNNELKIELDDPRWKVAVDPKRTRKN